MDRWDRDELVISPLSPMSAPVLHRLGSIQAKTTSINTRKLRIANKISRLSTGAAEPDEKETDGCSPHTRHAQYQGGQISDCPSQGVTFVTLSIR